MWGMYDRTALILALIAHGGVELYRGAYFRRNNINKHDNR